MKRTTDPLRWLNRAAVGWALCWSVACFTSRVPETPPAEPETSAEEDLQRCHATSGRNRDWHACRSAGIKFIAANRQPEAIQPLFYACNGRLTDACMDLGLLHLRGDGIPRDTREAAKAFGSAGSGVGEASAWRVLLRMQSAPNDASARDSRDFSSYSACDRATTGWPCYNYGVLLACGYFGDIDLPHALSAFHRGCFLADPRSCDLAGKLQTGTTELPCSLVGPDPKHPIELQLVLDPPDPAETWPEGEERFQRRPFRVER